MHGAESTVAATKTWLYFSGSHSQYHTEQRWLDIVEPFVLPGHHLICLKHREERSLIQLKYGEAGELTLSGLGAKQQFIVCFHQIIQLEKT